LGAYLLLSIGKLGPRSPAYHWLNIVGAVGFVVNGWWHGAIPSASVNIIWAVIGGAALWRIAYRSSSTSAT